MVWKFKLTVEVPLVLSFISFQLVEAVLLNLLIFRTCYVLLAHDKTECSRLGNNNNDTIIQNLEKEVQPYANIVMMVRTATEQTFNLLLCMLVGPWSDKLGRKSFIILSQAGMAIGMTLLSINSCFDTSPWYFMISDIPSMLTGGGITYFTVVLAYISDISTEETRGIRMAIYETSTALGTIIGNAMSSYIFYATNYATIFGLAAGSTILGIMYTIIFIPESLQQLGNREQIRRTNLTNFKEMYQTLTKARENNRRSIILISILVLILINFVGSGEFGVMFLFLREKLNWNVTKYTLYLSITTVFSVCGTMMSIYIIHKKCAMRETLLALIGLCFMFICVLLQGLAIYDHFIYIGAFLKGAIGGVSVPMLRTLVSKSVSVDEVGKVFSTIMATAYLIGLGGGPLYSFVYNATISINSGIFNYLSAGIHATSILLMMLILKLETQIASSNTPTVTEIEDTDGVIEK
ncbi:hippocampus abundant transcript 1 protein-like [Diorhabda carinulata]|uniref:hippocampus abundant transcript 1 protein-like n=1 Tax=Diorhabda carinulata TaxID=1163345 RepID=UPI0025A05BA9|nr:hippocampus abundant transcript 1 protein-like [Diorhabda carinulata]